MPPRLAPPPRWLLLLTVFTSGMTTLAIEVAAARLLQTTFGSSNLIWANIIGLMLLYLTIGYFVGGRVADRYPHGLAFYRIVTWGAFLCGLVPILADPIIRAASGAVYSFQAGAALASFVATLVLFAAPIILLGCVSPFAIRLAVSSAEGSGAVAGQIYGISTLGSILGTFLPSLLLFDLIGIRPTFMLFAAILLVLAMVGLGLHSRRALLQLLWMPVLLIVLALLVFSGPLRAARAGTMLLWEKDSSYNFIQVVELTGDYGRFRRGTRWLLLNEGQGIHSVWHPDGGYYGGTWDMFLAAPFFNADQSPDDVRSLCVVGLAGGTVSTQYAAAFGDDVQMDGIEIDPAIVEAGQRYFGMTQPTLNVIVEDGRLGLAQSTRRYDVIGIDAYRVPYVPWHLTTQEFFELAKSRLTERGVVIINVGRAVNAASGTQDRRLVEAMTNTMLRVFPSVHTLDVPNSFNTILVATRQPTTPNHLIANYNRLNADAGTPVLLNTALETAVVALRPTVRSELLFTDDRAPVETIINTMVLEFLLGGGAQQFQ